MTLLLQERYPELPGASQLPPPPRELFEKARQRRGDDYRPRTKHLRPDGLAKYTNRLFLETSPYLLQHAHNPVNWFPWGDEAFALARELKRPVLVSIGYATCHWCHVMEEESFENEEVATFLNENYIAVKVDREERPDVDAVYMTALHAMGMQGGWPLNVFLTPDRKPFYGGTYFPPYDHSRGIGFLSILKRLNEAYRQEPQRVEKAGLQLADAIKGMLSPPEKGASLQKGAVEAAVQLYSDRFDDVNGGLAGAPKFPSSLPVPLLLRSYRHSRDRGLFTMAQVTLGGMAAGGIYDQVGGGFHRYATDERWLVPHFEKMLYDNALLAVTYLEGYQLLGDPDLALVAREILRYLQRDMASPAGAFYAATDADSRGERGEMEEGFFFTWRSEELAAALGAEENRVVSLLYGVTSSGNFEGRNILHRGRTFPEVARLTNLPEERVRALVEDSKERLYQLRSRRPHPLRDEKILSSWNGLAISAFARAGLVLADPAAVEQARSTSRFILDNMIRGGRLAHSHQEGEARGEGFLDDYAFFIAGLIDLFEISGEALWLRTAIELTGIVQREFEDQGRGGFFMTGSRHEELIAREKPAYDGVVPSGNSAMVMNLLRLGSLTGEPRYEEGARRTVDAFAAQLSNAPTALSDMLLALDYLDDVRRELVIVAPRGRREAAGGLLDRFRRVFLPNRALVVVCEGEELERAAEMVPLLKGKKAQGDLAVAYLCENRSCRLPTSDPEELGRQLQEIAPR